MDFTTTRYKGRVFRVLVFPGATEIGLEINNALRECKDVELFSAGMAISNHAPFVFARHFEIPSVHEASWLKALNELVRREKIDYIFPAFDDVIVALAENASAVEARIVTSPLRTCQIARSKSKTYEELKGAVPVPLVYDSPAAIDHFPVFVKPDKGQGSKDAHVVRDAEQLAVLLRQDPTALILEYLPGAEYTIDCFSDRERGLLFCGGRERTRTRNGISVSSHAVRAPEFKEFALAISRMVPFHGAWFFQLKRDVEGQFRLLEIAPRVAGTMALHRVLGVNFPLLSLYEQERLPVRILTNPAEVVIDRSLVNRYRHNLKYDSVYIDLDDTLILRGKVNVKVVAFLYQCVNQRKKVTLLTRHAADLEAALSHYRLTGLFDEIVHMPTRPSPKSEHIKDRAAILIDDSFSERYEVESKLGIPTFDCSMLEMLIDDRA
jgi:carbamoyl-phosphate synthase large subunit